MKTWLFNPFTYLAGGKALISGFIFMMITSCIAFYSHTHFDGAIDAHIGLPAPFFLYVFEQLIAWGTVVTLFFIVALFLSSSKFRFIDIAGTVALARAPMLLVALIGFVPALQQAKPGEPIDNTVIAMGFLILIPVIWLITLLYNAFTVSVNVKGTKAIIGFIVALMLAELLSISLNHHVQSFLIK